MSTINGGNLAWQLGGDRLLVKDLARDAAALALVECRDKENNPVPVGEILGEDWRTWQDTRDGDVAGSVIAIRRDGDIKARKVAGRVSRLLQVSSPGFKVQARYLRRAKLRDADGPFTLFVVHIPLQSTGQAEEAMRVVSRAWRRTPGRKVLMADGNMPPAVFAAALTDARGRTPRFSGSGVMVVVWSLNWDKPKVHWKVTLRTDHKTAAFYDASQR